MRARSFRKLDLGLVPFMRGAANIIVIPISGLIGGAGM